MALPTPETLTALLRDADALLPEARVTDAQPAPLDGGVALTSRVTRLALTTDGDPDAPTHLIIKQPRPGAPWPTLYARELRFYRELAAAHDALPVPRCYHASDPATADDFLLVLDDLSQARPGLCLDGLTLPQARLAFRQLAALHARFHEHPDLQSWPRKTWSADDAERIHHGFLESWPALVAADRHPIHPLLPDAILPLFMDLRDDILTLGADTPHETLLHSDLHAENLLLDGDRLVLFDWQNACRGNAAIDVSGLLTVCQTEAQLRWPELLQLYATGRAEHGAPLQDPARLARDLRRALSWTFAGVTRWLTTDAAGSERDADTILGHWERLTASVCIVVGDG